MTLSFNDSKGDGPTELEDRGLSFSLLRKWFPLRRYDAVCLT